MGQGGQPTNHPTYQQIDTTSCRATSLEMKTNPIFHPLMNLPTCWLHPSSRPLIHPLQFPPPTDFFLTTRRPPRLIWWTVDWTLTYKQEWFTMQIQSSLPYWVLFGRPWLVNMLPVPENLHGGTNSNMFHVSGQRGNPDRAAVTRWYIAEISFPPIVTFKATANCWNTAKVLV